VVALQNCNACHANLEVHGSLRNNTAYCVICHNPENSDFTQRPSSKTPALAGAPPQGINFALMIHKIHTGANLQTNFNQDYVVVGFGGSTNDFGVAYASVPSKITNTGVLFPAMGPTGATRDTAQCYMCHANNSQATFPIGLHSVTDPEGLLSPVPATTSACLSCHLKPSDMAHAQSNTDPKFGESCDVCHAAGAAFDVLQVHAGQ